MQDGFLLEFILRIFVRTLATASLAFFLLVLAGCGGGKSPASTSTNGPLSGNWQFNLLQDYPRPTAQFGVSGFLTQSTEGLTGSVQLPAFGSNQRCGGVSVLSGTISGQNVAITVNDGGTVVSFTGTISSGNNSMSGDYQALGGACFTQATTGTWNAFLIPPLNGNFTGTLDSEYMQLVTGANSPVPITVSGTMTQSDNAGASNATLTGTINAVGYPCFATATMSGTISGQDVYLALFGFNGEQIGTLGVLPPSPGATPDPATVVVSSTGVSLVGGTPDSGNLLLGVQTNLGSTGPCPSITASGGQNVVTDTASVILNF
jgi:hypothetical protein